MGRGGEGEGTGKARLTPFWSKDYCGLLWRLLIESKHLDSRELTRKLKKVQEKQCRTDEHNATHNGVWPVRDSFIFLLVSLGFLLLPALLLPLLLPSFFIGLELIDLEALIMGSSFCTLPGGKTWWCWKYDAIWYWLRVIDIFSCRKSIWSRSNSPEAKRRTSSCRTTTTAPHTTPSSPETKRRYVDAVCIHLSGQADGGSHEIWKQFRIWGRYCVFWQTSLVMRGAYRLPFLLIS